MPRQVAPPPDDTSRTTFAAPDPAPEPRPPRPSTSVRLARRVILNAQHKIASGLGVDEDRRTETVISMLENNVRRAPGYWIQLFLSMGIATLGLVLGSTAVVIGAMLVSPLMGPIVELGMGFATGSSLLVIRAALRITLSVVLVLLGAALLTLALPYHEVTAEIAARTAPTALDLLVAVFCALAAAYTTVRPASDTTAAAAGTAIGIALVPPLCTAGFGLGTLSPAIAGGATLLFVANLSAILVFAVVTFLLLGFNMVDSRALEERFHIADDTRTDRIAARAQRVLQEAFGSRYGVWVRVLVPLVFLAAVYVPLSRALDEVAWEVRTRDAIRRILNDEGRNAVQTSALVERQSVAVRLVLLGTAQAAADLERRLETRIAAASGITPTVSVTAVPDAQALSAATTAQNRAAEVSAAATAAIPIAAARERVQQALGSVWPTSIAGRLVSWDLVASSSGPTTVITRHLGPPVGAAAESLMARSISTRLGHPVAVRDAPLSLTPIELENGRDAEWLQQATQLLRDVSRTDSTTRVLACVSRPASASRRPSPRDRSLVSAVETSPAAQAGRVAVLDGARWSIRAAIGGCEP